MSHHVAPAATICRFPMTAAALFAARSLQFLRRMVGSFAEFPTAEPFLPERITLPALTKTVQECRGCPLYKNATQAVFGEGPQHATVMFVGEQPGDQEDQQGKPFVGPAGRILDETLEEVGIDRRGGFVTKTGEQFKVLPRGARRDYFQPKSRGKAGR